MIKITYALVISLLVRMIVLTVIGVPYWYDEIIFISFSKQSLPQLLETLMAEPHPPGFFLLLKLFPVENVAVTRLSMLVISYALVGIGLWYGYKTKIIQKANLSWGIALFLVSYSFYSATMYVRDRSISIPLAFCGILILINILDRGKKNIPIAEIGGIGVIGVLLLFLSYDVFGLFMIAVILLSLYIRKRELFGISGVIGAVAGIYGWAYGVSQILGNHDRGIWFSYVYNSLFHSFYKHIAGVLPYDLMTDAAFLIYLVLIGFALSEVRSLKKQHVFWGVAVGVLVWIGVSYALHLLPRAHYVAIVYLLVSIIAGWGMERIAHKKLQYVLFAIVTIVGFGAYMFDTTRVLKEYATLTRAIAESVTGDTEYGLLSSTPLMPYVMKIEYFPDSDLLLPMQIDTTEHLTSKTITASHLAADTIFNSKVLTLHEIEGRIAVYGVENILYYQVPFTHTYHADPEDRVLAVLASSCTHTKTVLITETSKLYVFSNCTFDVSAIGGLSYTLL